MFINAKILLQNIPSHNKINYDSLLKTIIEQWQQQPTRPELLIHSCCAPCSTYVLEYLSRYANITIYFANSNIHPRAEYEYRSQVQQKFIADFNSRTGNSVQFLEALYQPAEFLKQTQHLKNEPEGGQRCHLCYNMRLELTAEKAAESKYDYFASALTLSPKKSSQKINEQGLEIQERFTTQYLPSDFKKNSGYQRSIQICKEYDVYRQCYCGCIYAAKEQNINFRAVTENAKQKLAEFATRTQTEES